MSLVKKSDVKNHLSPRHHKGIHLASPSQPDATGFSADAPGAIAADPSSVVENFVAEHSSSEVSMAPADQVTSTSRIPSPAGSKSVRP